MAKSIIKTGGNPQKVVFTMLVAILLLEFGSLTKVQKIWGLAFSTSTPAPAPGGTSPTNSGVQVNPTHPTESM